MFSKVRKEELRVPADLDHLKEIRDFIGRIGKKYHISEKIINAFKLAADEASTNIIRHAYRDKSGDITVRAIIRKRSVTISLIDQGRYFDPNRVKDPDLKRYVAIGKRGGLGIFMIRRLVDEMDYRRTEEGNELRLTKNREVERKPFFSFLSLPSIPISLRVRYYSVSAAVVTAIIIILYIVNYHEVDNTILQENFRRMESIATLLSRKSVDGLLEENFLALSKEAKIIVSENPDFIATAIITNSKNMVLGTTDPTSFPVLKPFSIPQALETYREDVHLYSLDLEGNAGQKRRYFVIKKPVVLSPEEPSAVLGNVYLFVDSDPVFAEIRHVRAQYLRFAVVVFLLANAGLGLLIFLIFVPLQKLATWVRNMGEVDIEDAIEIDTSSEIGRIAQAFSEITDKFRESQKSLAEQERLQQEMHLAREIQQTLLPAEFPEIEGYEIASYYEAAKEVGGDYYDFVEVDRHRMGIVVADVSGKGVPGSLVMTMIRTALRTEAKGRDSAAEVLARVNDFVLGDMKKGMFVTLFYMILDSRKRRITFASAGHNPLILYRSLTNKTYYLNPKGFPVGISLTDKDLFRRSIEDDTIQLTKGDILICHTDGITEAMNSRREMFGEERLLEVIRKYGHLGAKQFVEKLKEELVTFTEGQIQNDDITLVVIKEKMSPAEAEFEIARQVYYEMLNGRSMSEACRLYGMPVSRFSQKYKRQFEKVGAEEFKKEFETTSVEAKHLSIEEVTKIYDIIRKHPEWGAKRIAEALNTEEYGFTKISEWRVYQELVRRRLNTRALREAYVSRSAHKKRMKPPGTPLLTLDGRIILEEELGPKLHAPLEPVIPPKDEKEEAKPEPVPPEKRPEAAAEKKPRPKKKAPEEKPKPAEEMETAEIVLGDLVEILDKSRQKPSDEDLSEGEPREEIAEEEAPAPDAEMELDDSIRRILGGEDAGDEEEKMTAVGSEEMDLDTDDLVSELFEDRANGNGPVDGGSEPGEDVEGPEEVVLEEVIESLGDEEDLAIETGGNGSGEKDGSANESSAAEVLEEEMKTPPGDAEEPERLFQELSVQIQDETGTSQEIGADADKNIDDLLELLEDAEQIGLEETAEAGEPVEEPAEKATQLREVELQQKLLMAGGLFYVQKKYEKAVQVFEQLIARFPETVEAYYNLGNAYFRLNRLEEARRAYEKACELDPTYLEAWENLGVIYANQRKFKEAIEVWKKILEHDPKRGDIKKNIEKALRLYKEA